MRDENGHGDEDCHREEQGGDRAEGFARRMLKDC